MSDTLICDGCGFPVDGELRVEFDDQAPLIEHGDGTVHGWTLHPTCQPPDPDKLHRELHRRKSTWLQLDNGWVVGTFAANRLVSVEFGVERGGAVSTGLLRTPVVRQLEVKHQILCRQAIRP